MARMTICSSVPQFTKDVDVDVDVIFQEDIEEEVTKRMRTLLGMGKITSKAEYNCTVANQFDLWNVSITSGTGVHFASLWVRVYKE